MLQYNIYLLNILLFLQVRLTTYAYWTQIAVMPSPSVNVATTLLSAYVYTITLPPRTDCLACRGRSETRALPATIASSASLTAIARAADAFATVATYHRQPTRCAPNAKSATPVT